MYTVYTAYILYIYMYTGMVTNQLVVVIVENLNDWPAGYCKKYCSHWFLQ